MPYFFSFFDIGRQAALTCYIPTSDTSCFRCGSGIKKTVSLYFGFFFSFSLSCTGLNMKLLQCSRYRFQHRGQFPCISLSPSFCPASSSCTPPPFPSPICLLQACVYLTEGRADSLVYSNAASSSVFITVTSLNPTFPATF